MFIKFNSRQAETRDIESVKNDIKIWVRGYIIYNDHLSLGSECALMVAEDYLDGSLNKKIPAYNGCWQIIVVDPASRKVYVANDRWGSYPLFRVVKDDVLYISDNWRELLPYTQKKMDEQSTVEMIAFGYVLGNKTLIEDMDDFASHNIQEFYFEGQKLQSSSEDYWHLTYRFLPGDERKKEKEFAELWQSQLAIYAAAIRDHGNACYVPMSGGLDSRLLASEFDRHGIDIYAMTFGSFKAYDEIDSALQVVSELHHTAGHYIQYLNEATLKKLAASQNHCNRITSGYFGQLYLDYFYQIRDKCRFIVPGFSGDFMGGSLIRYRMLRWKSDGDAIRYILEQRSAPMVKALAADERYRQRILAALESTFPHDDDLITNYVRWFTEHDIRRYLIRSVMNEGNPHGFVLLPFFDYRLMDFFLELPLELLINKRLYVNTQLTYLYRHHPELIRIPRSRPRGKIRKVGNAFVAEYGNKIKNRLVQTFESSRGRNQWDEKIDWYGVYGDMDLPGFLDERLIRHPNLLAKPNYIKFFDTVSKVYRELASC